MSKPQLNVNPVDKRNGSGSAGSAGLTVPASSSVDASVVSTQLVAIAPVYYLMPSNRTLMITMAPDWNQAALETPWPVSFFVVLGPTNTTIEDAKWCFELNLSAELENNVLPAQTHETAIDKGSACKLWFAGKRFGQYGNVLNVESIRFSEEFKTASVEVRTFANETNPNALIYAPAQRYIRRDNLSISFENPAHLKIIQGHSYYLNISFGSNIAQLMGLHGWRPIIYCHRKAPQLVGKVFKSIRLNPQWRFENFVTNWAKVVELNPFEEEPKIASEAKAQALTKTNTGGSGGAASLISGNDATPKLKDKDPYRLLKRVLKKLITRDNTLHGMFRKMRDLVNCGFHGSLAYTPRVVGNCGHIVDGDALKQHDQNIFSKLVSEKLIGEGQSRRKLLARSCPSCNSPIIGAGFPVLPLKEIVPLLSDHVENTSTANKKENENAEDSHLTALRLSYYAQSELAQHSVAELITKISKEQWRVCVYIAFESAVSIIFFETFATMLHRSGLKVQVNAAQRRLTVQLLDVKTVLQNIFPERHIAQFLLEYVNHHLLVKVEASGRSITTTEIPNDAALTSTANSPNATATGLPAATAVNAPAPISTSVSATTLVNATPALTPTSIRATASRLPMPMIVSPSPFFAGTKERFEQEKQMLASSMLSEVTCKAQTALMPLNSVEDKSRFDLIIPEHAHVAVAAEPILSEWIKSVDTELDKMTSSELEMAGEKLALHYEILMTKIDKIKTELSCRECKKPALLPKVLSSCGHIVCEPCLKKIDDVAFAELSASGAGASARQHLLARRCPLCRHEIIGGGVPVLPLKKIAAILYMHGYIKNDHAVPGAPLIVPNYAKEAHHLRHDEALKILCYAQSQLAQFSVADVLTQITPNQWRKGVYIVFESTVSRVFFETYATTLQGKAGGLNVLVSAGQRMLVVKLVEKSKGLAEKAEIEKELHRLVKVATDGRFTITIHIRTPAIAISSPVDAKENGIANGQGQPIMDTTMTTPANAAPAVQFSGAGAAMSASGSGSGSGSQGVQNVRTIRRPPPNP